MRADTGASYALCARYNNPIGALIFFPNKFVLIGKIGYHNARVLCEKLQAFAVSIIVCHLFDLSLLLYEVQVQQVYNVYR